MGGAGEHLRIAQEPCLGLRPQEIPSVALLKNSFDHLHWRWDPGPTQGYLLGPSLSVTMCWMRGSEWKWGGKCTNSYGLCFWGIPPSPSGPFTAIKIHFHSLKLGSNWHLSIRIIRSLFPLCLHFSPSPLLGAITKIFLSVISIIFIMFKITIKYISNAKIILPVKPDPYR